MNHPHRQTFLERAAAALQEGALLKLSRGHPTETAGALTRLLFRPVVLRGEPRCSVVSRFATRDETKNLTYREALSLLDARLGVEFQSAHLVTHREEVQLELAPKARLRTRATAVQPHPEAEHDRRKERWVSPDSEYLKALGVADASGRVRERMGDKFRQIERFVDLLAAAVRESGMTEAGRPITACDMGAGKGYLTFAAYDYLRRVERCELQLTGIELRPDLVTFCNRVAQEQGFAGLRFVEGAIGQHPLESLDLLIALHACNTATDDALAAGVKAGAAVILVAPCCHQEMRPQVDAARKSGPLYDVLRHGVFAERHAEMATDALRVLLLEHAGYRVRVAEFVSPEHTAKNVMLIATRPPGKTVAPPLRAELEQRIAALKSFYGIERHHLETVLLG